VNVNIERRRAIEQLADKLHMLLADSAGPSDYQEEVHNLILDNIEDAVLAIEVPDRFEWERTRTEMAA